MNSNPKPGVVQELPISEVNLKYMVMVRDGRDLDAVDDYVERLVAGKKAPAIEVTKEVNNEGIIFWGTDGGHRVEAAKRFGSTTILAHIVEGTEEDALKAALKANTENGVRRSNGDKRKIGLAVLKKYRDKTDGYLAELTDLSRPFISALRKETNDGKGQTTRVSRSGKKYTAKKASSGRKTTATDASDKATNPAAETTADPAQPSTAVDGSAKSPDGHEGDPGASTRHEAGSSGAAEEPSSLWDHINCAHACEALLVQAAELADRNAHKLAHRDRLARAIREVLVIAQSEKAAELKSVQDAGKKPSPKSKS